MEETHKGYESAENILYAVLKSIEQYIKPTSFVEYRNAHQLYKSNKIVQAKFAKISKDFAKTVQDMKDAQAYFKDMDYQYRKKRDVLAKQYFSEHGEHWDIEEWQ